MDSESESVCGLNLSRLLNFLNYAVTFCNGYIFNLDAMKALVSTFRYKCRNFDAALYGI